MKNTQIIAENIKIQAPKQNVTIKKLLEDCSLGPNTVYKIASGNDVTTQTIYKIADYLNCSVDYLLGRENNANNSTGVEVDHEQQYDETTMQAAEMFSNMNIINKTKVLNFMIELSEAEKSRLFLAEKVRIITVNSVLYGLFT